MKLTPAPLTKVNTGTVNQTTFALNRQRRKVAEIRTVDDKPRVFLKGDQHVPLICGYRDAFNAAISA
jgi:hypothetical protein